MPSSFTWLDYSERERRKVLDAIRLFKDQDTRDELGIGTVRDAFADLLFPGTGTVQSRARYFLFVPWMYLELERRKSSSEEVSELARKEELRLIDVLGQSEDADGTIGIRARRTLKRLPSNIYWQGLGNWGIRVFWGSQDQYHRSLDGLYATTEHLELNDDKEPTSYGPRTNWHAGLPTAPKEFPRRVSFQLNQQEAKYLREAILRNAGGTLLAFLVDQGQVADDTDFPWQYHQFHRLPAQVQVQLEHARNFSEIIHGAALLYNLMLAEAKPSEEKKREYKNALRDWARIIVERSSALSKWDREKFWETVASGNQRVPHLTRQFIDRWIALTLKADPSNGLGLDKTARRLIHERERKLKRSLARLDSRKSLDLWNGAAGTKQLNYRWGVTQRIVRDILEALV